MNKSSIKSTLESTPKSNATELPAREHQISWANKSTLGKKVDASERWSVDEIEKILTMPFMDLLFRAQKIHREKFNPNEIQRSTLLSIKSGGCPEDCSYCPQSARYDTGLKTEKLLPLQTVLESARSALNNGATRFCMGAAWRNPKDHQIEQVAEMITRVKELGLETCVTLGMLNAKQTKKLKIAGLDYYNHNLDTSPEFYSSIITTRTYQDRLDTLQHVRDAGMKVCSGGIVGLGESTSDRAKLIAQLANLPHPPESVPINNLVRVAGTPLASAEPIDPIDFIRVIATTRICMPQSMIRLSAGREEMSESTQTLCILAGANSIFYGEKLLITDNPAASKDHKLFEKLGLKASR